MKKVLLFTICIAFISCSTKKQIRYLQNADNYENTKTTSTSYTLQPQDILKIDVYSSDMQTALPYNKPGAFNNRVANATLQSLQLEGYLIDDDYKIKFPVLGDILAKNKTLKQLEEDITFILSNEGHLLDPIVSIRLLNGQFTILGEVITPGTFSFVDDRISLLQALGYAGDLSIDAVRDEITLIREAGDYRQIYTLDLTNTQILDASTFYIHPNDVIIVQPNYRKVKSAGFIGSPSSIASISSLLLSITLLLINN
ncbi:MAG: polysaccharide biosynthesis/export family protein [Flavobacteriales bacterium]|nr:polysaccharide biosynthesis/export family protein [Flavobacteriales bacterium]